MGSGGKAAAKICQPGLVRRSLQAALVQAIGRERDALS